MAVATEAAIEVVMEADLVIVGAGMAANRLLQELAERPGRPQRIVLFGEEPRPAYNRVLLSPLLAGELEAAAVELHDRDWYRRHGIELVVDDPVVSVDTRTQQVVSRNGLSVRYGQLVLATGSRSSMPALPGVELDGVMGFRTWHDVERMREAARESSRAVVVGGGLLGLEAAEGLRKLGMETVVLQRGGWLLNRQLDRPAATLLQQTLEERGLTVLTGAGLRVLQGAAGRVQTVELSDGRQLDADLVVIAAGVTPETAVAQAAGLHCERAICVDSAMRSSAPEVYALGECCQFEQHTYGLVAPIWRQAEILAAVLCGEPAQYREQPVATQLKVSGIELFSCGEIDCADADVIEYRDPPLREYRRLWLRQGRLVGAVLYGDTRFGPWYFQQLLAQEDVSPLRAQLLFGPPPETQVA